MEQVEHSERADSAGWVVDAAVGAIARRLRDDGRPVVRLAPGGIGGWRTGPLVGLEVRPVASLPPGSGPAAVRDALTDLDARRAMRLDRGGSDRTGLLALAAFDLAAPPWTRRLPRPVPPAGPVAALPRWTVWEVDVSYPGPDGAGPVAAGGVDASVVRGWDAWLDRVRPSRAATSTAADALTSHHPAVPSDGVPPAAGAWSDSLPREAYVAAVLEVQRHIERGDIYQANLCLQRTAPWQGDPLVAFERLIAASPAPYAAYVSGRGGALASISPECFIRVSADGLIETIPIKGTRGRGRTPQEDRRLRDELLASSKDAAELLMIVDLERNDLGRLCRPGSVTVDPFPQLETFPAVHHLTARVRGALGPAVRPSDIVQATFPGGSISGAPKRRALEILASIEPVDRGWFTGSLFWFGDDGSLDSSILIRSAQFTEEGRVVVGAGGGIVADSDPAAEWDEARLKAGPLERVLDGSETP